MKELIIRNRTFDLKDLLAFNERLIIINHRHSNSIGVRFIDCSFTGTYLAKKEDNIICSDWLTFSYCYFYNISLRNINLCNMTFQYCRFNDCEIVNSFLSDSLISACCIYKNDGAVFCVNVDFSYCSFRNNTFYNRFYIKKYSTVRHCNVKGTWGVYLEDSFILEDNTFSEQRDMERSGVIITEPRIGYKALSDNKYAVLEIPKGAVVFSYNGEKCRTNHAKVVRIIDGSTITEVDRGISMASSNFVGHYLSYYTGDEIFIKDFNLDYRKECASGIHFFRTFLEAIKYYCN